MSVDSVIKAEGAEKKESVAAWVVDKKVCAALARLHLGGDGYSGPLSLSSS